MFCGLIHIKCNFLFKVQVEIVWKRNFYFLPIHSVAIIKYVNIANVPIIQANSQPTRLSLIESPYVLGIWNHLGYVVSKDHRLSILMVNEHSFHLHESRWHGYFL